MNKDIKDGTYGIRAFSDRPRIHRSQPYTHFIYCNECGGQYWNSILEGTRTMCACDMEIPPKLLFIFRAIYSGLAK